MSVRKEQRYDDIDHQINTSQKIVSENRTYASLSKYGKKANVVGDSHLQKINRKLFNESLPDCGGSLKYFSGAKTLDLEHYIKPAMNNNQTSAVVKHIGTWV